jgi:conjugative relaxase-like TrwC/TraI family protein
MLRVIMSVSAKGAEQYFDTALKKGDYYVKEQGIWGGKGADRLGLKGEVTRKEFLALASNKVPGTEENLTVRTKDKRTAGCDFCYSVPKSVSVYLALAGDRAVERMINEAFRETMVDVEAWMETRVRGANEEGSQRHENRTTGNMVYAAFVHTVSRPIDGIPDPHYHIHGYIFNATFDPVEERWKAGQFMNLKADAPFFEAAFNARLADKLLAGGYGIRRTERVFELASVSRELIEKFSKRTLEIERLCKEKYTILEARARKLMRDTGMDFADAFAQVKAELGAESRQSQATIKLSGQEQLANWRSQMTPEERESLEIVNVKASQTQDLLDRQAAEAIAISHLFERSSVARELHAAAMPLRRGLGRVSVAEALNFSRQDGRFVRPLPESRFLTTREAMQEETDMLKLVEAGRGKFEGIGQGKSWKRTGSAEAINEEQAAAVEHVLRSRDLVTAVRGVAGSGKTTMLDQAVRAIADLSGLDVMAFAPSASATEVLRKQGFKSAATVQKLLSDPELQRLASGKILLVDEAGFLSVREMRHLVSFAVGNNCRVILSGDSRQHHSVERGDALRILEKTAAVASAALTQIFRQQIPALRAAIEDLSQGRTEEGFDKLDVFGVIREIARTDERIRAICELHIGALKEKQSSLIVAPTHGEGRRIAAAVRKELRAQGLIEEAEHTFTRLEKLNLTKAQCQDAINYLPGHVVEFHRRAAGGFKSGEQWQVIGSQGRREIVVERNGERRFLPLAQAGKFTLFRTESVALSVGDTVRITKNFRAHGTRFRNNELHTVTAVEAGKVTLDASELGGRGALHLDQGIVVTSHASQGKTVGQVIVSVPVESFSQTNEAQFYVSMSRAHKAMHLFTDSKVALREAVTRKSARLSPWELIACAAGDHTQTELIAKLMRAGNGHRKVNSHTKGQ